MRRVGKNKDKMVQMYNKCIFLTGKKCEGTDIVNTKNTKKHKTWAKWKSGHTILRKGGQQTKLVIVFPFTCNCR